MSHDRMVPEYRPKLLTEPLPPYTDDGQCVKCHHDIVSTRYVPDFVMMHGPDKIIGGSFGREALIRCCRHCGYSWAEAVVSS